MLVGRLRKEDILRSRSARSERLLTALTVLATVDLWYCCQARWVPGCAVIDYDTYSPMTQSDQVTTGDRDS